MDFGYEYYDIKMEKYLNSQYMDAEKKMGLQILRNENITNIFIRKFIGLGIVFLMLLIMNSCDGDDDPIEPDTPTVSEIVLADKSQSTLEFDAGASTQTVRFSTTQAWSAEVSSGDWCTVSPASGSAGNGSITVSVSENTEEAERNATVTLKAGEASLDLEVTQSLTSFDVEEVAGYITEVTETVDELFMQSDGMAELSQSVEEIRLLDGVQDVSVTDDALYVEIKDGGIMSWYYSPKPEPIDVNAVTNLLKKSLLTSMASTKSLAFDHAYIEPQKFCIINQTANDESFSSVASGLSALKNIYDDVFDIELIRGEKANLDFFASLTDFDFVFLETHGNYSNHQHWLATGESVTNETRQWLNSDAGRQWRNKSIGIMTLEETRKSKVVKTAYWAISEKFIESMHDSFDNSIIFSTACKSLKESNTLASAFQNKGAGIYVGYDETNAVGAQAGINFWGYMSLGMTVEQAIENIPDENKIDSKWGGVLHFYPQSNGNLCIVHPAVNTSDATNIGGTTATLQGEITGWIEFLNADEAEAGFCWGKSSNPLVEDSQVKSQSVSKYRKTENTISLSEDIVELEPNATYYYRAFLKMNGEYYYGDVKEFETAEQEDDGMRAYLVKLYHDTDGDNWERNDNWLSDKPITEWYGVEVTGATSNFYNLSLRNNNLHGSIDLSNCSYLTSLYCDGNVLARINVSNCINLRLFDCFSNGLEQIDVTGCVELSSLQCDRNNLTQLDLSANENLRYLSCSYNNLDELVLSKLKLLEYLNCQNNLLNTLELTHNKKLQQIFCANNKIGSIDLTSCSNLESFYCSSVQKNEYLRAIDASGCTQLEDISCDNCSLQHLNVSGCINLKELFCYENELTSIIGIEECISIEILFCNNNNLNVLDVVNHNKLEVLNCDNNKLNSLFIDECINLKHLSCCVNNLTSLHVDCPSLETLSCSDNKLTDIDISNCPSLSGLTCHGNLILKEIPESFKTLDVFGHDIRYIYEQEWDSDKKDFVTTYKDTGIGWWYPGEPGSGKHAWSDE